MYTTKSDDGAQRGGAVARLNTGRLGGGGAINVVGRLYSGTVELKLEQGDGKWERRRAVTGSYRPSARSALESDRSI
jgi:hypothetical protein